ncbi:protein DUF642 L-GALACTONO-1,4-LACTONE-RESPONSIVE GENE 2 [Malania oleifera]|uniref:protein DUF642 L-GALACTONO-1,4-LACTONE-RESPONSIVE GENE 2 n=1 Tax=Malania oleifera TaxID=397392 RepID=UPI0025ADE5D4|nr:protein DUF642 L-GALACTONO-1,4-LACTONE-RESPONSIVE GENE 2 [Malania oleifera]
MQKMVRLLPLLFMAITASADLLQNSDFESPPSNLTRNSSTAPLVLLNQNTTAIPGWSFEGEVWYVTAGPNISLPEGSRHAIQLGQDGKINQTFTANGGLMDYILTFTLAQGGQKCLANATGVIVSAPDSISNFSLKQGYGKEAWESYGHYLGSWGDETEAIDLVFQSKTSESDSNSTCWPTIDTLLLKTVQTIHQDSANLLVNGGFETGPDFLGNSSKGILLETEPIPPQSALQQWSVMGTVKYIDSKHYFVPEGKAAVEIVSGVSSGVQTAAVLMEGLNYNLAFTLGDANDSCLGDFLVGAQAGSAIQNFTVKSSGTGSAKKFSMDFKAESSSTLISFISYTSSQTKDGVFCGPVVDDVVLTASSRSHGQKLEPHCCFLVHLFLLGTLMLLMNERLDLAHVLS